MATDHSKRRGGIIENALTDYPCWADNKLCCATFAQQKDTAASQIDEQIVKKFDEAFNNGDAAALAALEHGSRLRANRLIVSLAAEFQNVSHRAHGDLQLPADLVLTDALGEEAVRL